MRILAAILIFCLSTATVRCDEPAECQHQPITVKSRPVIERLPLKVIDPVDVAITEFGATLVADRQAGIVFLLTEDGGASVLIEDCQSLERVSNSQLTGIYALASRKVSSTIYRITDSGFASEFVELNYQAVGLATDGAGRTWTSNPRTGQVIMIDVEGRSKAVSTLSETIVDLTADDQGAYVLTKSGRILSVGADGSSLLVGHVSPNASRIKLQADHQLVALSTDPRRFGVLLKPAPTAGPGHQIGKVPFGTQAFAYDGLNNLTLANPDLRALTRVTSHFQVPCPHCGQPVSMTLSTAADAQPAKRRSF